MVGCVVAHICLAHSKPRNEPCGLSEGSGSLHVFSIFNQHNMYSPTRIFKKIENCCLNTCTKWDLNILEFVRSSHKSDSFAVSKSKLGFY